MFQSIKWIMYLEYDKKTKEYSYEYELTDSEFGTVKGAGASASANAGAGEFLIRTYEERSSQLVIPNFFRYLEWIDREVWKQYGDNIEWIFRWHGQYNKRFPQYKDAIHNSLFPWLKLCPELAKQAQTWIDTEKKIRTNEAIQSLEVLLDACEERSVIGDWSSKERDRYRELFEKYPNGIEVLK